MWFRSMLQSLALSPRRRKQQALDRMQQARRLLLEGLEDRRLLTFAPAAGYPVGDDPQAVVAADFNNDGRLDLATANSTANSVSVLLGNPDGTFQPAQNSPTGTGPRSVAVGDFDGDGKLDLATANLSDGSFLKGDGLGGFAAPASIDTGSSPSSVAVGDFNADGKMDLAVGGHTSYYIPPWSGCGYYGCYGGGGYWVDQPAVSVLLGNGTGGFGAPTSQSLGGYGYDSTTIVAVADLNGDGLSDLAAATYNGTSVFLGTGATGLSPNPIYSSGPATRSLVVADATGDGKLDLVAANTYIGGVSVLLGNGLGNFAFDSARMYNVGATVQSAGVADFNGDGEADIATANADGSVSVLLGTGLAAAASAFKPPLIIAGAGSSLSALAVGTFNGDARSDLAATIPGAGSVAVLLNDGVWPALDAPSISISDATSVAEGNVGTVNASFTVSLSAQSNQPVSVVYSTQDGSATGGSDYQTKTETLTFAPGETSKSISVAVSGDRIGESREYFLVKLTSAVNAFIADSSGTGTILDDEPVVSIDGYFSDLEGNVGTKTFTFTVSLSNEYDIPVTVDYSTADLTPDEQWWYGAGATAGDDYELKTGTVTFAAHQTTSESITVLVNGDREGEYDELFFVNLSNPSGAILGSAQAFGTIVNDEPYVWIDSYASQPEGNSGQAAMTFTLHLSNVYDLPVTVDYVTADGNATAGSDYTAVTGSATIAAGTTSQTITVQVNGDTQVESDEYFSVNLTGATNASLSSSYANGSILDDDTPPSIYIGDAYLYEGNSGTSLMAFTVWLSQPSGEGVWVNYATANGSATVSNSDYVAKSGQVYFAPGETSKTIEIVVKGDTKREKDESFSVNLSGAAGGTITDSRGVGSILNDDGGGKGNGKGNQRSSYQAAVDAALYELLALQPKKRGR